MSAPAAELVRRGVAAVRRSGFWWGFGIVAFALVNLAFWPSLEASGSLAELEDSMGSMLEAFGAAGLSTPAGYLDGQLYAFLLPLLLSGAAIAMTSVLTSGDEDAGRLELIHALPIRRPTIWLARLGAATLVLAAIVATTAALVVATLAPFSLEEAGYGRVLAATAACGALALFHGAVAYALGGFGASRGLALGGAIAVLVVGYVVGFVLPIADSLAWARGLSPWNWAIGEQPVSDGISLGRLALLLAVTALLVVLGTWGVTRRDIRTA